MKYIRMKLSVVYLACVVLAGLMQPALLRAEAVLKPFVLASQQSGQVDDVVETTRKALQSAGFQIVGQYSPYKDAMILVVTNDVLKSNAAASMNGGFGAMQRVAVTGTAQGVQVSYTNPVYMANVYRMKSDLGDVSKQLQQALGKQQDFGAAGKTPAQLRKYHYKMFMPYFDEPYELKSFASYDAAINAIESGLAAGRGGTTKVYRIDIPGKQQTVYGVALSRDCSGDEFIMGKIDFAGLKSTAHLPYELLVNGGDVIALHAKFRIAQSFPDLSMVGDNSFWSIMCAPGDIEKALGSLLETASAAESD